MIFACRNVRGDEKFLFSGSSIYDVRPKGACPGGQGMKCGALITGWHGVPARAKPATHMLLLCDVGEPMLRSPI